MSRMSSPEIAELSDALLRSAAGDKQAFSVVYDSLSPTVFSVILSVVKNQALAEEVAQDVFVEAWRKAQQFDPQRGNARTWIARIAHARAVDRLRAHIASMERDDRDAAMDKVSYVIDVESDALANVESQRLHRAVKEIGEPHSTAVALAFFGGLSHAELAELTDVPLGTAKTRVRDGIRKLQRVLGQEEQ